MKLTSPYGKTKCFYIVFSLDVSENHSCFACERELGEIIQCNYHVTRNLEPPLDAWRESTRKGNLQRHTSDSRQEEFIVHEDVVGKDCVVSPGCQRFN